MISGFLMAKDSFLKARSFKQMTGLNEGLAIKTTQGITVVLALIMVAFVFWFLTYTRTGKSMRAYSNNEDLALLSGINPERVVFVTWVITAVLITLAGTLYGLDKAINRYLSILVIAYVCISYRGRNRQPDRCHSWGFRYRLFGIICNFCL